MVARGVPARNKGARLEYRLRDLFASYLDCKMSRTPFSGSFGNVNKDSTLVGDIYSPDYDMKLCIECKNHAKPSLKQFWEQTVEQCPFDKDPMLIFHLNRKDYVVIVKETLNLFTSKTDLKEREMQKFTAKYLPEKDEVLLFGNKRIYELKTFMKNFAPKRNLILGEKE